MDVMYRSIYEAELTKGKTYYALRVFGDYLAKREGYSSHTGIEAIQYFLINKYHWLPSHVKSISMEDLHFLMEEEITGWELPQNAIPEK